MSDAGDHQLSILLVEDDPTDTHLLLSLLDHADLCEYQLRAVVSAADAERALADERFDVVLLDLSLPDCDGLDSVERILAHSPSTPIVVLTGQGDAWILTAGRLVRARWTRPTAAALTTFTDAAGKVSFGVGVGSLVLAINVVLLGGYTLGCHSLRHLVGGGIDQLTRAPARHKAYDCVSCLNRRHMHWAWASLVWVAFSDLYVRPVAEDSGLPGP